MPILREFWTSQPQAEEGLRRWWARAEAAKWVTFADVRQDFPSADLVRGANGDKLVFNIGGNKYRLIALVKFGNDSLFILWVGTHAEYNKLDVQAL